MKKINLILIFLFASITMAAQNWTYDMNNAKIMAKEKNKKIILVFSGSDWCAPCMKLEKEICESEGFKNYAKDNYVLLRADFPKKKKDKLTDEQQEKNNMLAKMYNKQGYFPLVVVLDSKAKVLGTTGYQKVTPKEYIKILNSF